MTTEQFQELMLRDIDRNATIGYIVLVVNLVSVIFIAFLLSFAANNLKAAREFLEIAKSYAKTTVSETKEVKSQLVKAEENTVKAIERATSLRRSDQEGVKEHRLLTESDGHSPPLGGA